MTRGIVIYAFKKPAYGIMAWNLAVSIKAENPHLPIAVLTQGGALSTLEDWRLGFFDHIIPMKDADVHYSGKFSPGKGKIEGYKYFPFDQNMIIDADSICIGDLTSTFNRCTKPVHAQVVDTKTEKAVKWNCQWMPFEKVKEVFTLPAQFHIYEINSSWLYIEKGETGQKLYEAAINNLEVGSASKYLTTWGGTFPDELAWNVAFAQLGIHPQFEDQKVLSNDTQEPVFFSTGPVKNWTPIYAKFPLVSMFGGPRFTHKNLESLYDGRMNGVGEKFGFPHHFKWHLLNTSKHVLSK